MLAKAARRRKGFGAFVTAKEFLASVSPNAGGLCLIFIHH